MVGQLGEDQRLELGFLGIPQQRHGAPPKSVPPF
jgi:hypothetical protein